MYVYMYGCMCVCTYVCMYVCMEILVICRHHHLMYTRTTHTLCTYVSFSCRHCTSDHHSLNDGIYDTGIDEIAVEEVRNVCKHALETLLRVSAEAQVCMHV